MSDILLDEATGDIAVVGLTPVLTTDLGKLVRQRLKIRLDTYLGEWFLNSNVGVPYFQKLFKKPYNQLAVDSIFKGIILETEDVSRITSYSTNFDTAARTFSLTFSVLTSVDTGLDITILQVV